MCRITHSSICLGVPVYHRDFDICDYASKVLIKLWLQNLNTCCNLALSVSFRIETELDSRRTYKIWWYWKLCRQSQKPYIYFSSIYKNISTCFIPWDSLYFRLNLWSASINAGWQTYISNEYSGTSTPSFICICYEIFGTYSQLGVPILTSWSRTQGSARTDRWRQFLWDAKRQKLVWNPTDRMSRYCCSPRVVWNA